MPRVGVRVAVGVRAWTASDHVAHRHAQLTVIYHWHSELPAATKLKSDVVDVRRVPLEDQFQSRSRQWRLPDALILRPPLPRSLVESLDPIVNGVHRELVVQCLFGDQGASIGASVPPL